jgi:hypothetical protein
VGDTSCPGEAFYKALGDVRDTAVEIQQGERDVNPTEEKKDSDEKKSQKKESGKKDSEEKSAKEAGGKSGGDGSGDDDLGGGVADLTPGVAQD